MCRGALLLPSENDAPIRGKVRIKPPMSEQIVLVTGAKGGLGTSITKALAGIRRVRRRVLRATSLPSDFPHPHFLAVPADLMDSAQAARLVETVVARCGRIDALVHLAGGFTGGALHETNDAVWDEMMNVNLRAAFHAFRAVIPRDAQMRAAAESSRSAAASPSRPRAGVAAYAASKAALVSLVRSAALENRDAGHHRQCHPARHDRHRQEPRVGLAGRSRQMGFARPDRRPRGLPGVRRRRRHHGRGDSGVRRQAMRRFAPAVLVLRRLALRRTVRHRGHFRAARRREIPRRRSAGHQERTPVLRARLRRSRPARVTPKSATARISASHR